MSSNPGVKTRAQARSTSPVRIGEERDASELDILRRYFHGVGGELVLVHLLGADPIAFLIPIALAASIGFMLPVATPPNALAFSASSIKTIDMVSRDEFYQTETNILS